MLVGPLYWTVGTTWASRQAKRKTRLSLHHRNVAKRADGNQNTHAFVASPEIVNSFGLLLEGSYFNPLTDSLT